MKTIIKTLQHSSSTVLAFVALGVLPPSAQAQGKAEAAKAALEAAVDLGPKLHQLIAGYDRSAEITIRNHTNHNLVNIRTYADSGKVVGLDLGKVIPAKGAGGVVAKKSEGAARGAVGLVSWDIQGTDRKLILMYSVPYDYNLYDNWYGCEVGFSNSLIDKNRFDAMYDDEATAKKAGSQNTWNAVGGTLQDQALYASRIKTPKFRWQMTGTMEDSGNTKIVIDFYDLGGE